MQGKNLESTIQGKIIKYLESISFVRKVVTANRSGTPDISGCYKGLYFSLEVKQPGEGASTLQAVNTLKIRENLGLAFVVSSLDEVKNIFESLEKDMIYRVIFKMLNKRKADSELIQSKKNKL